MIGAFLGGLVFPAIFLKRAPLPALVVGGASIGIGGGVWAHLIQSLSAGEKVKPEVLVSIEDFQADLQKDELPK